MTSCSDHDAPLPSTSFPLRRRRTVSGTAFYEPFTTLAWLAGITGRIRYGTTVLIVPYRHPLLIARMAANLSELSGGRLILGVGVGWAEQEFDALGVPFRQRGS